MASRTLTKRLYINYNGGNNNVSLDWTNAYNAYPYGSTWSPPTLKLELLAPSNEPVLYSAQNNYGGGAQFINASDVVYQPVNGSQYPLALTNPYLANSWRYGNVNANTSSYYPFYNKGAGWGLDFALNTAL